MMARRDPKSGANRLVRAHTFQKQQRAPVGPRAPPPDEEDPRVRLALESFGYRAGKRGRVSHGPQRLGWISKSSTSSTRVAFPIQGGPGLGPPPRPDRSLERLLGATFLSTQNPV